MTGGGKAPQVSTARAHTHTHTHPLAPNHAPYAKRKLLISRIAIGFVCLAAIAVTLLLPSSIFERVLFAWIALGATFGPVVVVKALGWAPSGKAILAALLTGFGLSTGMIFVFGMGTGSVWSTIAPWIGAFSLLSLDKILRRD